MLRSATMSYGAQTGTSKKSRKLPPVALLVLLAGTSIIGTVPIFVRLSELGPYTTGFWRVGLALPVLLLWSSFDRQRVSIRTKSKTTKRYIWLIAAGICFAGDLALFNQSLRFTSVTNATLLINMSPIFVVLGARMLFGERIGHKFALGLGIALIGATVLVGATFTLGMDSLSGDFLALLSAIATSGYTLSMKRVRDSFSAPTSLAWGGTISGIVLLTLIVLSGENLLTVTLSGWLPLFGLALISHVGGQGLITYALAHLPASITSICFLMQPVVAASLAWGVLQEPLGGWQAVGGVVVLAGICLAQKGHHLS